MNNFEFAFQTLMYLEGFDKVTNSKKDKGGKTKYGISIRFLKSAMIDVNRDGHVDEKDISDLTEATAKQITYDFFWMHYRLNEILDNQVAAKLLSIFFNMRGQVAARVLQRALWANSFFTAIDGIAGKETLRLANSCNNLRLVSALRSEQADVYRLIIQSDPTQKVWETGWMNRAYGRVV